MRICVPVCVTRSSCSSSFQLRSARSLCGLGPAVVGIGVDLGHSQPPRGLLGSCRTARRARMCSAARVGETGPRDPTARRRPPRLRLRQLRGGAPRGPRRDRRGQRRPPDRVRRGRLHVPAAGGRRSSTSASQATAFPVFNGTGANVAVAAVRCCRAGVRWSARRPRTSTRTRTAHPSGSAASSCSPSRRPTASSRPSSSPRRPGGSATSTARSPASSRSRRPPSSARSTRPTRSARWPTRRTSSGLRLHLDGARHLQRRRERSACRCARSRPTPASTSSRSAAPRTGCCSARPSSCSTRPPTAG